MKIGGFRVELGEIEFHAKNIQGVVNAAAIAKQDAAGTYLLYLFLEGGPVGVEECKSYLTEKLPPYMIPHGIQRLERLPINQNGKVDRKQLLALAEKS